MSTRPVWVEISLNRLLKNYETLRHAKRGCRELLPVVKANAYGHDVLLCAPRLVDAGAHWLGVTGTSEALQVRTVCPTPQILLMSGIWSGEAEAVIEHKLTPVVWEHCHLDMLEEAATRRGLLPGTLPVHMEIDTGMSRQGVRVASGSAGANELRLLLGRFHARSCLKLEGVMTHFSAPENLSSFRENPQLKNLSAAVDLVLSSGHRPEWLHAGNSTTIVTGPDREKLIAMASRLGARLMLRPGLALYGYLDRVTCDGKPARAGRTPEFEPVLAWKTRVVSLRTIQRGETAGYDNTFTAQRLTRLALLPAGYADGVNRALSNRGHVLIRGEYAPIAGRVSMDQMVVDVTDIPGVSIGDETVLIGSQGSRSITAWDIADLTGTIPWEVLCAIGARVPRQSVH